MASTSKTNVQLKLLNDVASVGQSIEPSKPFTEADIQLVRATVSEWESFRDLPGYGSLLPPAALSACGQLAKIVKQIDYTQGPTDSQISDFSRYVTVLRKESGYDHLANVDESGKFDWEVPKDMFQPQGETGEYYFSDEEVRATFTRKLVVSEPPPKKSPEESLGLVVCNYDRGVKYTPDRVRGYGDQWVCITTVKNMRKKSNEIQAELVNYKGLHQHLAKKRVRELTAEMHELNDKHLRLAAEEVAEIQKYDIEITTLLDQARLKFGVERKIDKHVVTWLQMQELARGQDLDLDMVTLILYLNVSADVKVIDLYAWTLEEDHPDIPVIELQRDDRIICPINYDDQWMVGVLECDGGIIYPKMYSPAWSVPRPLPLTEQHAQAVFMEFVQMVSNGLSIQELQWYVGIEAHGREMVYAMLYIIIEKLALGKDLDPEIGNITTNQVSRICRNKRMEWLEQVGWHFKPPLWNKDVSSESHDEPMVKDATS